MVQIHSNPRPERFARNPQLVGGGFTVVAFPPHSATKRWQYTVPTGKRAVITVMFVEVVRCVAPTTSGRARVWIISRGLIVLQAKVFDAAVGARASYAIGLSDDLEAGRAAEIWSEDPSTLGSFDYIATVALIEYDA